MKIDSFRGEYRFLSNFYYAPILRHNVLFPTNEHAYQATKTLDFSLRRSIAELKTPGEAKRAGNNILLRPDWEFIKLSVMLHLVREKFTQNINLGRKLVDTGSIELVEGNYWHDTFWGVCGGAGQNYLGRILMCVRDELK